MKSLLIISFCIATTLTAAAQVGLSTGQSIQNTTANPNKQQKVCSECGIAMGNITYAWQHQSWCPYYKPRSSGSSSSAKSFSTYSTASVVSSILGSMLVDALSPKSQQAQAKTPEQINNEKKRKRNGMLSVKQWHQMNRIGLMETTRWW